MNRGSLISVDGDGDPPLSYSHWDRLVRFLDSWAHWRRQFFDLAKSPPAPIAVEALKRIAELYEIEAEIRGKSARERRAARQEKTKPLALKT